MQYSTPDELATKAYSLLVSSATKPAGLEPDGHLLDHDLLPVAEEELPVVGVYLVEDRLGSMDTDCEIHERVATVRVEIRSIGSMLAGTRVYREWALATLLPNDVFGSIARGVVYRGFQPFGIPSDSRLAGADLDFDITYLLKP